MELQTVLQQPLACLFHLGLPSENDIACLWYIDDVPFCTCDRNPSSGAFWRPCHKFMCYTINRDDCCRTCIIASERAVIGAGDFNGTDTCSNLQGDAWKRRFRNLRQLGCVVGLAMNPCLRPSGVRRTDDLTFRVNISSGLY